MSQYLLILIETLIPPLILCSDTYRGRSPFDGYFCPVKGPRMEFLRNFKNPVKKFQFVNCVRKGKICFIASKHNAYGMEFTGNNS